MVGPADPYLSPFYNQDDLGKPRVHALARRLAAVTPGLSYTCITDELSDDAVVNSAVAGSDRVINCLDEGHHVRTG